MTAVISAPLPALPIKRHGRRRIVAAIGFVVVLGLVGLYALRAVPGKTSSTTGSFTSDYRLAVAAFRADTDALRAEGSAALGQGTAKLIPVYEHLRDLTKTAATRFASLKPPRASTTAYQTFVRLMRLQAQTLQDVVQAAKAGNKALLGEDLRHYAALVSSWLTSRQQLESSFKTV